MNTKEQEEQRIFNEAMYSYEKYKRTRALKALFEKHSYGGSSFEDYNYFMRAFIWTKILLCLLLDRTMGSYMDSNTYCFLAYDERHDECGSSWDAVWISTKIFSSWQVCVGTDGT